MSPIEWVRPRTWLLAMAVVSAVVFAIASNVCHAQEEADTADTPSTTEAASDDSPSSPGEEVSETASQADPLGDLKVGIDTVWVLVTAMLVFFMNLGFACVESGFCRAKNAVNILSKNFIVFAVTTFFFWILGWGIMFGTGGDYFGKEGLWFVSGADNSPATGDAYSGAYKSIAWAGVPLDAKFFFQLVFAGTAATIVSGAVAERIKYISFIVFSAMMAVFIYPVVGHWIWGGGWLGSGGFLDFAGSTQVHSIGGWAALVGVYMLGPRIGKYDENGKPKAIPGHNMTAATIGCLILWLGWFGFNPGSTMSVMPNEIAHICVTTNTAAAVATLTATAASWLLLGKPDIGMTLNGCLAGLVAVTAPCAYISATSAAIIGACAGVLVVLSVLFFDRIKADDPVGATSVHLANGIFGTLCVGLFAEERYLSALALSNKPGLFFGGGTEQLTIQIKGVAATAIYVVVASIIAWGIIKATLGIRVSPEEEREGLDRGEHGNEAYHGFVMSAEAM